MATTLHYPARTWTDTTDSLTAALLNQELRDNFNFLQAPPYCKVGITTPPVVATGVNLLLAWTKEYEDADNMHDNVTNNSRIVAPVAGIYRVHIGLYFPAYNGIHDIKLAKNAGGVLPGSYEMETTYASGAVADYRFSMYYNIRLAANDYLEAFVFQNSGANQTLSADGDIPYFEMRWVRV